MKCPHCLQGFHSSPKTTGIGCDRYRAWSVIYETCPECGQYIIRLQSAADYFEQDMLVYPKGVSRSPPAREVPEQFAQDYREACLVLTDSPKASAALSRRCLQHLLREEAKVKPANLADEIQQVLDSKQLPSFLTDAIDGVRNIGNFAAHPVKSTSSGEIVDVEPGEAEWLLDTLEGLFDFYFVLPAKQQAKRDELNQKLKDAAKPEMK